ncbi:fungal-specific transcription factor domain-containing protein [Aspergillus pseudotamarii]|uniref:Fungal-specific transcription factor domain-containing protein n=1 Tax=Aspergillus pseudotamarii TaxID=132259 RepID=A0A5N6SK52_ASPPS|nr:fungal-specific transcription factor domain-containing protein [Aspergillus pseudotamarii]KAE8135062.1 fungal-specific transcription factor domain-containing protein [Aspergillus pseudotamarii]
MEIGGLALASASAAHELLICGLRIYRRIREEKNLTRALREFQMFELEDRQAQVKIDIALAQGVLRSPTIDQEHKDRLERNWKRITDLLVQVDNLIDHMIRNSSWTATRTRHEARDRLLYLGDTRAISNAVQEFQSIVLAVLFGSSSAGSFMREIQSAISARLGASHRHMATRKVEAPQLHHRHRDFQPSSSGYEEPALFLLPPRNLADGLMQAYWDNNWSLYPVIDRCKIEATYESLWTSHNARNYPLIPISVINLCFAIGCYYCELLPPRERKATSDDFFTRAESLYKKTGETISYERVQCLLLFGIYLQSTTSVSKCWMTVGQAIRMAQSLGIHVAQHDRYREAVSHREYQRRTWHGCIWLDRVLSSTLGRPGMIPKWLFNSIPLPSMIDDEFFETQTTGSPFRPDGRPCRMAFVVKAMELYQILDEILVDLYLKTSKDEDIESKLMRILQIDSNLQAWKKSLPEFLHPRANAEADAILKRQAIVLRVRSFLHARILLFRPTVICYCMRDSTAAAATMAGCCTENEPYGSYDDCSLSEVMLAQCVRISFRIARELIETFDHHLNRQTLLGPLPNWWYSILYVYNATMMILVERFLETKDGASPAIESKAERTWNAALRVLKSYGVLADSATRCVAVLEIFLEKLFLRSNNNNNGNGDSRDTDTVTTTPHHLDGYDWDALWAMSNSFGQESSFSDSNLFPLTFDGYILSDLLSSSLEQGFSPADR